MADDLERAWKSCRRIKPLTTGNPDLDAATAYRVAASLAGQCRDAGTHHWTTELSDLDLHNIDIRFV